VNDARKYKGAHCQNMHSHTHYIDNVISRDLLYVPTKFGENTSKDEQMYTYTRESVQRYANAYPRARSYAHVRAVNAHEKYAAHASCGDLW
jgi:hypothetical protein